MSFLITWKDLESIMFNEVRCRKTKTSQFHSYMRSKMVGVLEVDSRMVVTGPGEKMGRKKWEQLVNKYIVM